MSNKCEIGHCPNHATRSRKGDSVCEIHYSKQDGLTNPKVNPEEIRKCECCGYRALSKWGEKERLIEHHVSYEPEETVLVCDRCHSNIHNNAEHEFAPSQRQLWKAEKKVRKSDISKLAKVGKVRISYRKSDDEKVGKFVKDGEILGFKQKEKEEPVWMVRDVILRSNIEFLEEKPWNI